MPERRGIRLLITAAGLLTLVIFIATPFIASEILRAKPDFDH